MELRLVGDDELEQKIENFEEENREHTFGLINAKKLLIGLFRIVMHKEKNPPIHQSRGNINEENNLKGQIQLNFISFHCCSFNEKPCIWIFLASCGLIKATDVQFRIWRYRSHSFHGKLKGYFKLVVLIEVTMICIRNQILNEVCNMFNPSFNLVITSTTIRNLLFKKREETQIQSNFKAIF